MSRKRIPLNQNGCTANFRIGVPFEQNLHLAANMLLQDKAKEIQEIAFCLGYENPGKFSSAFRSVMGLSPAEYRFRKETYDGK